MDAAEFTRRTGQEPKNDDLQRVNCSTPGKVGHFFCGWCPDHNKPRFMCGCWKANNMKRSKESK